MIKVAKGVPTAVQTAPRNTRGETSSQIIHGFYKSSYRQYIYILNESKGTRRAFLRAKGGDRGANMVR